MALAKRAEQEFLANALCLAEPNLCHYEAAHEIEMEQHDGYWSCEACRNEIATISGMLTRKWIGITVRRNFVWIVIQFCLDRHKSLSSPQANERGKSMSIQAITAEAPIFTSFEERHAQLWGSQPIRLEHRLHQSPLFSREGLAQLIESYPREHYSLVYMGAKGQRRFWREGDIGGLSGAEVIEAIANGRMWLNLRNIKYVDKRYQNLVQVIFDELAGRVPGFRTFNQSLGILISSPKAQVYYHADLPGQSLWQIVGRKRVYVYPATKPFITPEQLEGIALFGIEVDMPYNEWYDEHALWFDLEPGQMLHWPLNAPHRVENYDCLNVSMTMEYWTEEIRRSHVVNVANAIMRHRLGLAPRSRATSGPGFYSKALLQRALRNTKWVKRERAARRPIDFKLDRANPGGIVDITTA